MISALENTPGTRRRSLRRSVRVEADVEADLWDGAVPFVATDLSEHGLWLESDLPLEIGAELIVSFLPPRWPSQTPVTALAEVTRVGMFRRRREPRASGMGLRFLDIEHEHRDLLAEALRGLPPLLPASRKRVIELDRPSIEEGPLPHLVLADGSRFTFRAEAPLLTAGRGLAPAATVPAYAPVIAFSSPMSAILQRNHALRVVA